MEEGVVEGGEGGYAFEEGGVFGLGGLEEEEVLRVDAVVGGAIFEHGEGRLFREGEHGVERGGVEEETGGFDGEDAVKVCEAVGADQGVCAWDAVFGAFCDGIDGA